MFKPRVAVLGASGFGKYHIRELLNTDCEIIAILGSSEESAKRAAKEIKNSYDLEVKTFSILEQLLNSEKLEGVSICTPPEFHLKQIKECLSYELHVISEKPLIALDNNKTYEDAINLFQLAYTKNRILTVNTQWPAAIEQIADYKKFQKTIKIEMESGSELGIAEDILPHANSLLIKMTSPAGVVSNIHNQKSCGEIKFEFDYQYGDKSCRVNYFLGFNSKRPRRLAFSCSDEYFHREYGHNGQQILISNNSRIYLEDPLKISLERFANAMRGVSKPLISPDEVLANMRIYDLLLENLK